MRSMTGCGRGHAQGTEWDVTADIRSVNHRFLDIASRLGQDLQFLQETIRQEAGRRLKRGHLDVTLTVRRIGSGGDQVDVNMSMAEMYFEKARSLAASQGCEVGLTAGQVLMMEGVCTVTQAGLDPEVVSGLAREAVRGALDELIVMRENEGERLSSDLALHLSEAEKLRERIAERAPQIVEEYRKKLTARVEAMQLEMVDQARLAQEVALMADRCAIDEELARLQSHFQQMRVYLQEKGEIGKKMDFLIQEMNREANTIGSKASDAAVARMVVDLKSEIEKMREQVQNVE